MIVGTTYHYYNFSELFLFFCIKICAVDWILVPDRGRGKTFRIRFIIYFKMAP